MVSQKTGLFNVYVIFLGNHVESGHLEEKPRVLRIICVLGCVAVFTDFLEKLVRSVSPDCTVSISEHKNLPWGNKLYGMGGGLN